jgi:hypothetical protein
MKIRLGDLRRIIREAVESELGNLDSTPENKSNYYSLETMMKLPKKITKEVFESIGKLPTTGIYDRNKAFESVGGNPANMHLVEAAYNAAQYFGITFEQINSFLAQNKHLSAYQSPPQPRGHENPAIKAGWI